MATLALATAAPTATAPEVPDPCLECAFNPPTVVIVSPGATTTLTGPISSED